MIVIDSSALIDALLIPHCFANLRAIFEQNEVIAPPHLDVECLQVLRKLERNEILTAKQATAFASELPNLPIERSLPENIFQDIWALRQNFTMYDAAYVQLARANNAVLLTHDERLARAAARWILTRRLDEQAAY